MNSTPQVVIPWQVDWTQVNAIDDGGPQSMKMAHTILGEYRRAGALCVRMPNAGDCPWLPPLVADAGLKQMVVIGWSSLFDPALYTDKTEQWRYDTFMQHVRKESGGWAPELIVVDQEKGVPGNPGSQAHPEMVADIEAAVPFGTPKYYYQGDALFHPGVGDGPCPRLYYIWEGPKHPLGMLEDLLAENPVAGGYPWLSTYRRANNLSLGTIDDLPMWRAVWRMLEDARALGVSLLPSPYSATEGLLSSPGNRQMLRFMQAGARVFG